MGAPSSATCLHSQQLSARRARARCGLCRGFGVQGSGFKVPDWGLAAVSVEGSGFRVPDLGLAAVSVEGSGIRVPDWELAAVSV
jgi:hypothetical protein